MAELVRLVKYSSLPRIIINDDIFVGMKLEYSLADLWGYFMGIDLHIIRDSTMKYHSFSSNPRVFKGG